MKVGDREQQGRTDGDRKGTRKKEKCPACQVEYLENTYGNKKKKMIVVGKYCPNKLCSYSRKNMRSEQEQE